MSKSELVIFMTSNSAAFVAISTIFMVFFVGFLSLKAKKINKTLEKINKLAEQYESKIEKIEVDSYSINKYNKATLAYIKEIRSILVEHKGKTFDTQLLKAIDEEMKDNLIKEKYNEIVDNFSPKCEPPELIKIPRKEEKSPIIQEIEGDPHTVTIIEEDGKDCPFVESENNRSSKVIETIVRNYNSMNLENNKENRPIFKNREIMKNFKKFRKRLKNKSFKIHNNVDKNVDRNWLEFPVCGNTLEELEMYKNKPIERKPIKRNEMYLFKKAK